MPDNSLEIEGIYEARLLEDIINEMLLPDIGITLTAAQLDITMICVLAATERTKGQWRQIIDSAGLMIERIWTKVQEEESIMVLVPKPASNGV